MKDLLETDGLHLSSDQNHISGRDLMQMLDSIKIDKSSAIKLIALSSAMNRGKDNLVDRCKEYLLKRCAKTGSYEDEDTGLILSISEGMNEYITSDKIETLKKQISAERKRIKTEIEAKGKSTKKGAKINKTEYVRWTLKM